MSRRIDNGDYPFTTTKADKSIQTDVTTETTKTTTSTDPPTSSSVQDWINQIPAPTEPSSTLQSSQPTPTHRPTKRRRYSESAPSEFLGSRRLRGKRRKPLQEMDGNMGAGGGDIAQLATPLTNSGTSSSGSRATSNVSPSKAAAALKQRFSAYNVGRAMEDHGMVHDDTKAFEKYPEFVKKVRGIVGAGRDAQMQPDSAQKFMHKLKIFERMNETTFLHIMFPLLIKDGYQLVKDRTDCTDKEKDMLRDGGTIFRDFLVDEGIMMTLDNEFLRTLVPSIHRDATFEASLTKALQKLAGVAQANPKPDFAFGLLPAKFPHLTDAPMPENVSALLGVAPGMYDPHLLVEGKADAGSAADAENQARRGGATIVHANRELRAVVFGNLPDIEGPDEESFMFSVTMYPKLLEIWVHWYEGPTRTQVYHMNRITSLPLYGWESLDAIRAKLHNIMEWAAVDRFTQRQGLYEQIHTYARLEHEKIKEAIDNKSPRKKRKAHPASSSG